MAKLVCQTGPTAGHEYPLTKDVTIMGRQSSCDVQILDNMSSRAHCQVRRDGKLYSLVDLGSRNGTALNGKKVTERQMAFGDRIRVGEAEYLLVKEPGDVELKDLLSKYEVQEKIGEGGMGIVFKANQRSMNRVVALKILSPKYSSKPRFVDQFIKEARAAGALNHPNIIQVHDVGTENNIHYFSMELVEGPTCMQSLRSQGTFKVAEALEITRQTAKALEYAHSQRLIHQDIKPDNIMIGQNDQVKLADLGISKTFDEVESEEGPKRVMGTPHYMAPEAALGKKIDHRVDIYSLGATLYHLLTGKTPYSGTSATEVLKAHVMDPLPPIHDINPEVPEDVCALVERMVAKKPDDRYQHASEIVAEIVRLQQGLGLGTERIAGGETMLLRRYAAGGQGVVGVTTPAGTTNTRTPRAHEGNATTAERPAHQRAGMNGLVKAAILLTICLLLSLVAWRFLGDVRVSNDAPRQPTGTGTTPTPKPPTATIPTPPPADDGVARRQATALTALEDQLKTGGAALNLDALRTQIEELRGQGLSPESATRAKLLLERVGQQLEQRRVAAAEQDFTALKQEVTKLVEDHNYQLALKRVEAFKSGSDVPLRERIAAVSEDVVKQRDSYLAKLHGRVQLGSAKKSVAELKALRDQLPPALIDSPADDEIKAAIKAIEDEQLAAQQVIVQRAGAELSKWNFSALEDIANTNRAAMGSSAAGKQLDTYTDAGHRLTRMITALGTELTKNSKYLVYRGTLANWKDPKVVGADEKGVQLEIAGGGITSPRWIDLQPDALLAIVKLVLSAEDAELYRPAIEALAAAKQAGEPGK